MTLFLFILLIFLEHLPHFLGLLFEKLHEFQVILLVLQVQQLVLLFIFCVIYLGLDALELAYQVLEVVIGTLHLFLF